MMNKNKLKSRVKNTLPLGKSTMVTDLEKEMKIKLGVNKDMKLTQYLVLEGFPSLAKIINGRE